MDYQTLTTTRKEEIKTEVLREIEESHYRDTLTLDSINTQLSNVAKGTKQEYIDRLNMLKAELVEKMAKEEKEIASFTTTVAETPK
jgi:predicted dinucleotide-binding enzyme